VAAPAPRAWGGAAARAGATTGATSLRALLSASAADEETVADLEGGVVEDDEDLDALLLFPTRAQQAAQAQALAEHKAAHDQRQVAQRAGSGADAEPDMFWDYGGGGAGVQQAAPAAPGPTRPAAPAGAGGTEPAWVRAAAGPPPGGAATAAVVRPAGAPRQAAATPPARAAAASTAGWQRGGAVAAAAAQPAAQAAPGQRGGAGPGGGGSGLVLGGVEVSEEFAQWCRQQMQHFNGNSDLGMVEVLWSLTSNSEVAECCGGLWADKPGMAVREPPGQVQRPRAGGEGAGPKGAGRQGRWGCSMRVGGRMLASG
jgi:hypothetical protein